MTPTTKITISSTLPLNLQFSPLDYTFKIIRILNQAGSFSITFVDQETIKKINKDYLNKNEVTDIISFNLGNLKQIEGDIYIAFQQAQENAKTFNNTLEKEIKRLIIHGILHLLDYKDYTSHEKEIMEEEENRLLKIAETC